MKKEGSKIAQTFLCVLTVAVAAAALAFQSGVIGGVSAAQAVKEVVDIADSDAVNEIVALAGDGVIDLTEDGGFYYFYPTAPLTREYMALAVARLAELDLKQYVGTPLDVIDVKEIGEDAMPYVKAAVFYGIVPVYSDTVGNYDVLSFRPSAEVSREEAVYVLSKLIDTAAASSKIDGYSDLNEIGDAYKDSVEKLVGLDILVGYGDGTLRPKATMTREEFAILLYKIKYGGHLG